MKSNQAPFMTTEFGWVFMGMEEMDQDDLDLLEAYLNSGGMSLDDVAIDPSSTVGRLAREYTAEIWIQGTTGTAKMGGEGSHTYETQKVCGKNYGGGDIEFKDEDADAIWHNGPDGKRCHGVLDYPNTGRGYHVDEWGTTCAGPRPESRAAVFLGKGKYVFQNKNAWWVVKK